MDRQRTLGRLRRHESAIRSMGATGLYIFGSVARDQAAEGSDVDLFIDYDAEGKFSLFDLVGIKQFLEEALQTEVDLTTRDSLHPALRERIELGAVRVF